MYGRVEKTLRLARAVTLPRLGQTGMRSAPFITIGVTTYDRKQMLVECVRSILDQSFSDFEVIIGNDYTQEPLSLAELGIDDPRIRIINHPVNLGELENMKYLLDHASGAHFTWLADDDGYHPDYLRITHDALRSEPTVDCVLTNYWSSDRWTTPPTIDTNDGTASVIPIAEFLERYLTKQIKFFGCYGAFKTAFLRDIGGMRLAGNGFGPYSDNLLGIKAVALGTVGYVDLPLIFYRVHIGAQSVFSNSLEAYTSAQTDLTQTMESIVRSAVPAEVYSRLQLHLFTWFVKDLGAVMRRRFQNGYPLRIWSFIDLVRAQYVSKLSMKDKLPLVITTARVAYALVKQRIRKLLSI
jgi:GT2 family glycosyltransferase